MPLRRNVSVGADRKIIAAILMTSSALASVAGAPGAFAQTVVSSAMTADQSKSFSIPTGSLAKALTSFGAQSGKQVSVETSVIQGLSSPGVAGRMTAQQALAQLLAGTGLTYRLSGNVVTLVPASASITLGPVRVGGTVAHQDPTGPGVGYVATTTMAGTKTDTPITEIPNSIYVVTKQLMQDQQPQSVVEALRYTPGVYSEAQGTYSNGSNAAGTGAGGIFQRGFSTTPFVDGLAFNSAASGETAFLERIEAVNGPASVMYGQVYPGGMIEEDLKKPTDSPLHQVSVGFGSWHRYETTIDLSDKITRSGNLRYRIAAIGVTSGTQTDYLNYHRVGVLPSVTWDIDHKTSLTLLGMYMYTPGDGSGDVMQYPTRGTLIRNSEFPEVPRSNFLGLPNWNVESARDAMFEYQFKHEFNKYISFSQTFRWANSKHEYNSVYNDGSASSKEVNVAPWELRGRTDTVALDSRISGQISTGSVKHTWVVGSDFRQYSYNQKVLYDFNDDIPINIYNPQTSFPNCLNFESFGCGTRKFLGTYRYFQEGVYFQDQIKWKKLSILLGGREDWVNYNSDTTHYIKRGSSITSGVANVSPQPGNAFTWRAGLIYNFDFGLAPYFSYSTSFVPQTSTDWQGNPFAPLKGNQLEAGIKYKVPGENILISASAFRINENHYLIDDLLHTGYNTDGGRVRSQGFEISANANITRDLKLIASYSYTDIRFAKTNQTEQRYNPYTDSYYGDALSEHGMSVLIFTEN